MNNRIIKSVLAALVLGGLTVAARADLMWDWSYTTTYVSSGYPVFSSGTLTTDPLSGDAYQITSFSGTFAGNTITALDPGFGGGDNLIYIPGDNGDDDSSLLDGGGLSFYDITGDQVNVFDGPPDVASDIYAKYFVAGIFSATQEVPAAAPEPAQMLSGLMVAGLGGASLLIRRFRNRK